VDIYSLDSYHGGFLSRINYNSATGFNVVQTYYQWFMNYLWARPIYLAEFKGGRTLTYGAPQNYNDMSESFFNCEKMDLLLVKYRPNHIIVPERTQH
jgi:hypothetical protein